MSDKPMLYLYYEPYSTIAEEAKADGTVGAWLGEQIGLFRQKTDAMFPYHQIYFSTDNVFGHLIMAVANGLLALDEFLLIHRGTHFVMTTHGSFIEKDTDLPLGDFTRGFSPSAIYLDAHIALTMGTLGKETNRG